MQAFFTSLSLFLALLYQITYSISIHINTLTLSEEALVKDIELPYAIADLVDNCVDGAKNLRVDELQRQKNDASVKPFKALYIVINLSEGDFQIKDNCGGISVSHARDYAFRFGRASGNPTTRRSVGHFGVGMKRALFKLGKFFSVKSVSENSSFLLSVDVDDWKNEKTEAGLDKWEFSFKDLSENHQMLFLKPVLKLMSKD